MGFEFGRGGWLAMLLGVLVIGNVLALWAAALLGGALGGYIPISMLSHRLIVDEEGVELVSLLRWRRVPWSGIARLQASMEYYRNLEIVLEGPPEESSRVSVALPVRKAGLRLVVETLNDRAKRWGILPW